MRLLTVTIDKPDDVNFILGQTHFIKSVEDIHEALVAAVPGIKFALAFCEACCAWRRCGRWPRRALRRPCWSCGRGMKIKPFRPS
jgi:adenosine/AMP kinase